MDWLEGRAGLRRLQRVLEIVGGQALILSGLSMLSTPTSSCSRVGAF